MAFDSLGRMIDGIAHEWWCFAWLCALRRGPPNARGHSAGEAPEAQEGWSVARSQISSGSSYPFFIGESFYCSSSASLSTRSLGHSGNALIAWDGVGSPFASSYMVNFFWPLDIERPPSATWWRFSFLFCSVDVQLEFCMFHSVACILFLCEDVLDLRGIKVEFRSCGLAACTYTDVCVFACAY